MKKTEKVKKTIRDLKVEDLKEFINTVQTSRNEGGEFKAERLQNMRERNFSRKYSSGFSS